MSLGLAVDWLGLVHGGRRLLALLCRPNWRCSRQELRLLIHIAELRRLLVPERLALGLAAVVRGSRSSRPCVILMDSCGAHRLNCVFSVGHSTSNRQELQSPSNHS